jgi:hypothetical protein
LTASHDHGAERAAASRLNVFDRELDCPRHEWIVHLLLPPQGGLGQDSGGERTRIRLAERGLTPAESSKYKPRLRPRRIFLDRFIEFWRVEKAQI